jgi:hypothetical protein
MYTVLYIHSSYTGQRLRRGHLHSNFKTLFRKPFFHLILSELLRTLVISCIIKIRGKKCLRQQKVKGSIWYYEVDFFGKGGGGRGELEGLGLKECRGQWSIQNILLLLSSLYLLYYNRTNHPSVLSAIFTFLLEYLLNLIYYEH